MTAKQPVLRHAAGAILSWALLLQGTAHIRSLPAVVQAHQQPVQHQRSGGLARAAPQERSERRHGGRTAAGHLCDLRQE